MGVLEYCANWELHPASAGLGVLAGLAVSESTGTGALACRRTFNLQISKENLSFPLAVCWCLPEPGAEYPGESAR